MPAWLAVNEQVPAPTMVTVDPLMVHTLVSLETVVTGRPDVAVGEIDTFASPYVFAESDPKVIVWLATFTANATASEVTDETADPAP